MPNAGMPECVGTAPVSWSRKFSHEHVWMRCIPAFQHSSIRHFSGISPSTLPSPSGPLKSRTMINLRPLAIGLAAIATLTISGCSDERELGYKEVDLKEYIRYTEQLEDQLRKKDEKWVHEGLPSGPVSTTDIRNVLGPNVNVGTREVEVVMSIESEVLFKSGSATLSVPAKSSLNKVAAVIKEKFPGYEVRVVGHTDDQKITRAANTWDDNWDLSTGRARQVLLYLEKSGIEAKRLGLAGYGQERPVTPNVSAENRQKNRRVEIIVIPPTK